MKRQAVTVLDGRQSPPGIDIVTSHPPTSARHTCLVRAVRAWLVAGLGAWLATGTGSAQVSFNPAAEFSATSNPAGVWAYGYSLTLGSPFIPFTEIYNHDGLDQWYEDISSRCPNIVHNPTESAAGWASVMVAAGGLALHPGPHGERCVLRFTAPRLGDYRVRGSWYGQDVSMGATTDVRILADGQSLFDGAVAGFGAGSGPSFNFISTLSAGSPLDFVVGFGDNNDFRNDMTGLEVTIALDVPAIVRQPESQIGVCRREATFSVVAQSGLPLSYQWYKGNTAIPGATSDTLVLKNLSMNDAGSYSVEVSNSQGSVRSRPATLGISAAGTSIQLYAGVTIEGTVGTTYTIQYTTNLNQPTWLNLACITLMQPVQLWYDSEPARSPARYYRVDGPCE